MEVSPIASGVFADGVITIPGSRYMGAASSGSGHRLTGCRRGDGDASSQ